MTLDDARNLALIFGVAIALATLTQGVIEYIRQGMQKRAELFREMRNRLQDNDRLRELIEMLTIDDPKLAEVPYRDKQEFIGYYEEVAILLNSGLIKRYVAHYMFSYYAVRCWESKHFWCNLNRNATYWSLFRKFVKDMKDIEKSFVFQTRNYKL